MNRLPFKLSTLGRLLLAVGSITVATAQAEELSTLQGVYAPLTVKNALGETEVIPQLRLADGQMLRLKPLFGTPNTWQTNTTLRVTGPVRHGTLWVENFQSFSLSLPESSPETTVQGELEWSVEDSFVDEDERLTATLHTADGRHLRLQLPNLSEQLRTGTHATVQLQASGANGWQVSTITQSPSPLRTAAVTGPRNNSILVIPMLWADTASAPFTTDTIKNSYFGSGSSLTKYFLEVSFNQHNVTGTVLNEWVRSTQNTPVKAVAPASNCNYSTWMSEAKNLAVAKGINLANYSHVAVIWPATPACAWAGLGNVGGPNTWMNGYHQLWVIGHEFGHNIGLHHANTLDCLNILDAPADCKVLGYADPYDIMGNRKQGHISAYHKQKAGYLPSNSIATHFSGKQSYTLTAIEDPSGTGTVYGIRIPTGQGWEYWVDFRRATGLDSFISSGYNAGQGATVRMASAMNSWSNEYGCQDTCLLDMSLGTTSFNDASLLPGQTYTDKNLGLNIRTVALQNNQLQVEVEFADLSDDDQDGAPNYVETLEKLNPAVKDNNIFADTVQGRRLFVMQQYRDLLAREGNSTGVQYWTDKMTAGLSRTNLILSFMNSGPANTQLKPLGRLMLAYFGQIYVNNTLNGWNFWSKQVSSGAKTLDEISVAFAGSTAFSNLYGTLNDAQFVDRIYQNMWGRTATAEEQTNALSQIGSSSRGAWVRSQVEAAGYVSASSNRLFVQIIFADMGRKVPSSNGEQYWLDKMASNAGATPTEMVQSYLGLLLPNYGGAASAYKARFVSP